MKFEHAGASHEHSLQTLNQLFEYDDFMLSIRSVIDLGCGRGDDLIWWATRTTRDEARMPLEIECTGIDLSDLPPQLKSYSKIKYHKTDFEGIIQPYPNGYDVLWCHDSFQYACNPLQTLKNWWEIASPGGVLSICVPITQQIHHRQLDYYLPSGNYFHYSLVSLIYMLATTGWDCRSGFFKQAPGDPWLHVMVYKSEHKPCDPKNSSWYELCEKKLIPDSGERSINSHGFLRQQDLLLPWIDHSLMSMAIR